jgi:hypothetical protein
VYALTVVVTHFVPVADAGDALQEMSVMMSPSPCHLNRMLPQYAPCLSQTLLHNRHPGVSHPWPSCDHPSGSDEGPSWQAAGAGSCGCLAVRAETQLDAANASKANLEVSTGWGTCV